MLWNGAVYTSLQPASSPTLPFNSNFPSNMSPYASYHPYEQRLDADKQAALDLHNQGNPLSPLSTPLHQSGFLIQHAARHREHNGQILCGITIWLAMPKPGLSKWPSLATSSIPQNARTARTSHASSLLVIVIILQLRKLGSRRSSSTPRYEAEEDKQKQWGHYTAIIWPEATRLDM